MQKQENQHNSDSLQKRIIQPKQLKLALLAQIPVLSPLTHIRGLHNKHCGSDWSQKQPISGSITKEEEAVETLYTLVGMFPNNDKTIRVNWLANHQNQSLQLCQRSGIMARLVINRVAWDSTSWPFLASRVTVHKKQS
ncbi:hypothetical protein PVL29_009274 [Vitis rotundifolia]|uniref:Uncharacterized protein n=1 Tax=Vitis rotundifolia TaxID=103349 RepID=A0AA38ZY47_VITRO|nr:hypothetical protein PVL29_009274 [Vitis rotundifolia]